MEDVRQVALLQARKLAKGDFKEPNDKTSTLSLTEYALGLFNAKNSSSEDKKYSAEIIFALYGKLIDKMVNEIFKNYDFKSDSERDDAWSFCYSRLNIVIGLFKKAKAFEFSTYCGACYKRIAIRALHNLNVNRAHYISFNNSVTSEKNERLSFLETLEMRMPDVVCDPGNSLDVEDDSKEISVKEDIIKKISVDILGYNNYSELLSSSSEHDGTDRFKIRRIKGLCFLYYYAMNSEHNKKTYIEQLSTRGRYEKETIKSAVEKFSKNYDEAVEIVQKSEESNLLKKIFRLRLQGLNYDQIAKVSLCSLKTVLLQAYNFQAYVTSTKERDMESARKSIALKNRKYK